MKIWKIIAITLGVAAVCGLSFWAVKYTAGKASEKSLKEAEAIVSEFGSRLKNVSLLAPEDELKREIEENYKDFVVPELLSAWIAEPASAPGRLVSSPWPEKIEIWDAAIGPDSISFGARVATAASAGETGIFYAADIKMVKVSGKWLISGITINPEPEPIVYVNEEFGFSFNLPAGWTGYSILRESWQGYPLTGESHIESGALISIRHPAWTEESPRQDIPIMVFTPVQWNEITAEELSVGAAPIPPSELGRNENYVFALPARYNFAFPEGFEEVEDIMESDPLRAF